MIFKNLSTKLKLAVGFGIVTLLSVIIGVFGYSGVVSIEQENKELDVFWNVESNFVEARLYVRTFMHLQDTQYYNRAEKKLNESLTLFDVVYSEVSNEEKEAIDNLKKGLLEYKSYMVLNKKIVLDQLASVKRREELFNDISISLMNKKGINESKINNLLTQSQYNIANFRIYLNLDYFNASNDFINQIKDDASIGKDIELVQKLDNYQAELVRYKDLYLEVKAIESKQFETGKMVSIGSQKVIQVIRDSVTTATSRTTFGINSITILVFILGILLSYFITKFFTSRLSRIVRLTESFSHGDLQFSINEEDLRLKEEIGDLTRGMDTMGRKLRSVVEEIIKGAGNVATGSLQLSNNTQQISQGAGEQAASVEEISSSMEEMMANIQQNTENAKQTEIIARNSADNVGNIKVSASQSITSIQNIANKITIINDIAFQTNILALNAAVEAARAGEHGRGFAVVASEVRKLAEKSKAAAEEIDKLSQTSVVATNNSASILNEMAPGIENTAKLVKAITASSVEQLNGADQINNAIQQLNHVAQQNAAVSEEIATTAEELAGQAEQLTDIVSFFKL